LPAEQIILTATNEEEKINSQNFKNSRNEKMEIETNVEEPIFKSNEYASGFINEMLDYSWKN